MDKEPSQNSLDLLKYAIEEVMPVNKLFGLKIKELSIGKVLIHMPFKEEFIGDFNQNRWHGGILASIADTAGGVAAASILTSDKDKLSTIDMRIDYLHGAGKGDVYAFAELIKIGKTILKADVKLFQKDVNNPIAVAICVYSIKKAKNE